MDVVEGTEHSSLVYRQKSALAAHKLMLDKQVLCDVFFDFTSANGGTKTIGAHKYMLSSRSSVFYAMFNNNKDTLDHIPITDNYATRIQWIAPVCFYASFFSFFTAQVIKIFILKNWVIANNNIQLHQCSVRCRNRCRDQKSIDYGARRPVMRKYKA